MVDQASDYMLLARHAADGAHEEARALLSVVSPVAREDGAKWTALHLAARHGRLRVLRVFLEFLRGVDGPAGSVDARDHRGRTALHVAARAGNARAARMLADAGASLDARDTARGETPAVAAAACGRVQVVEELLRRRGCSSTGSEEFGAAVTCAQCLQTAAAVLRARPRAARDRAEMSKALLAMCGQYADVGPLSTVRLLCALGADCDVKSEEGMTPLHLAAKHGWENVARFLLVDRRSRAVNELSDAGRTPLIFACMYARNRMIRLLLRHGANPGIHSHSAKESPLYRACHRNDTSIVRRLVDCGARMDGTSAPFESGVLSAALHGATHVVGWFTREGYDFSASCGAQDLPFHWGSFNGNLFGMQYLVALGANPAETDSLGRTPLHFYTAGLLADHREVYTDNSSADEVVRYLVISCGVDPDACRKSDARTALHIAAGHGHSDAVRALLKYGAAIDAVRSDGMTPLLIAVDCGYTDISRVLLDAGANANHRDSIRNFNALQWAAHGLHVELISLLVGYGASLDCGNERSQCSIAIALASWTNQNATEAVSRLLSHGALATYVSEGRQLSLLHLAAMHDQIDAMRLLLRHGADPSLRTRFGVTALHCVAGHSSWPIMPLLIRLGAEVDARDNSGKSSLHVAARGMVLAKIRCLADHQADVDAIDKLGRTPLMLACGRDESTVAHGAEPGGNETLSVISELVRLGANLNIKTRKGLTALHFASACGRQDVATALFLAGARVETRTRAGRTPLHLAAMSDRSNVVSTLAIRGASVDSTDRRGCSALHSASARGLLRTVRTLLELGARDDARDVRGRNALDAAARAGHLEIVRILLEHLAEAARASETAFLAYLCSARNAAHRHKRHKVLAALELQVRGTSTSSADNPVRVLSVEKNRVRVREPREDPDTSIGSAFVGELSGGDDREFVRRLTVSRLSRTFQAQGRC